MFSFRSRAEHDDLLYVIQKNYLFNAVTFSVSDLKSPVHNVTFTFSEYGYFQQNLWEWILHEPVFLITSWESNEQMGITNQPLTLCKETGTFLYRAPLSPVYPLYGIPL